MNRLTTKEYIADLRHELIESVGETYADFYLLKWLDEGNQILISGVPLGGEKAFEPLYPVWAKDWISKTLTTASDTVVLDANIRRILKLTVNGTEYDPKKIEDFDDYSSDDNVYTMTASGLKFQSDLAIGTIVKVTCDKWDKTLDLDNDSDEFEVIRPAYEKYLKHYVVGMAKNRNEYSATLADRYFDMFNAGVMLSRKESDNLIADDAPSATIINGLFS